MCREPDLFAPIAALMAPHRDGPLPDAATLTRMLRTHAPTLADEAGVALHFVAQQGDARDYEAGIGALGAIPTRPDNWHDYFNALAWCAWPHSKLACHRAHLAEIEQRRAAGLPGRGPRRDALTQFDECGILVVSSAGDILAALANHEWEQTFWQRRARLLESTRFLVFGHGTWEQLRAPFHGLCAKAIYRQVGNEWLSLDALARQQEADRWLAAHLAAPTALPSPRALRPVPLLGIPGVTGENAVPDYYRDTSQFRPRRHSTPHPCQSNHGPSAACG